MNFDIKAGNRKELSPLINNKIGGYDDFVHVPFDPDDLTTLMGFLRTVYYHIHGASFVYPKYADDVLVTAAAGEWETTGDIAILIPENTITKAFDLHWLNISAISESATFIIDFYGGPDLVFIGATKAFRSGNFVNEGPKMIMVPQIPANWQVGAKISSSTTNATTCRLSVEGHVYSNSMV